MDGEYDMEIEYNPERRMQQIVALSRNPLNDLIDVNIATHKDDDWVPTKQFHDSKVQERNEMWKAGDWLYLLNPKSNN